MESSARVLKILVFSPIFVPGFEQKDIPLANELERRGHVVTYAVTSTVLWEKKLFGFPGFPLSLQSESPFKDLATVWIESAGQLRSLICECDVLLLGHCRVFRYLRDPVEYAKKLKKCVVVHADHTDFGTAYNPASDVLCLQGEHFKERYLNFLLPNSKLDRVKEIVVTGAVRFDTAHWENLMHQPKQYEKFCEQYGLDKSKKLILWLPSGPQTHTELVKKYYEEICKIVLRAGFNLLIKGHPTDVMMRKSESRYGRKAKSWDVLTPGLPVCRSEDFFVAIKFASAGVSIESSVAYDLMYFGVPIIYVGRYRHMWGRIRSAIGDTSPSPEKFEVPNKELVMRCFGSSPTIDNRISTLPSGSNEKRDAERMLSWEIYHKLYFLGAEVDLDDLASALQDAESIGVVKGPNLEKLREIQRDYFMSLDGRAYLRIADVVERCGKKGGRSREALFSSRILFLGLEAFYRLLDIKNFFGRLWRKLYGR
jgi:hypothetical protein